MRGFLIALVALALATTCPAPLSFAAQPSASSELARLFGTWNCEGFAAGSSSVESYARQTDGSVTLTNRVHTSVGSEGTILETFAFDRARAMWTLSSAPNPLFGGLQLTGGRWSGDRWVLTGTEVVQNVPRPVRIVYTSLGSGAFRREHQAPSSGSWVNDGEFVCERSGVAGTLAARPAAASGNMPRPSAAPLVVATAPATPEKIAALRVSSPATALPPAGVPSIFPSSVPTRTPAPKVTPPTIASPTIAPQAIARPTIAPPTIVPPTIVPPTIAPPTIARPTFARPTVAATAVAPSTVASPASAAQTAAQERVASTAATQPPIATHAPSRIAARLPSHAASSNTYQPTDRAFKLVGSAWSCESVGGEPSTHRYSRSGDDAITLHDDVRVAQHTYAIVETYRFDAARRLWTTAVQGGGYTGTAAPWLHNKWIFDGIETERGRRSPVRMIYTTLGDQAFRRDFQLSGAGQDQTFVSETCTRG